jgi:hypothetical protein
MWFSPAPPYRMADLSPFGCGSPGQPDISILCHVNDPLVRGEYHKNAKFEYG